jgi:hypothetical protein
MEEDGDPIWAVGPGPHKIDVFDLVLVRLDHVAKGSWQAQLQLIHPRPWERSGHALYLFLESTRIMHFY